MDFNERGLIEPGIHSMDMTEFYDTFVAQFTTSQRRQIIFNNLIDFIKSISHSYKIYEIWIDGSYVTQKINPNDVDIVIFFPLEDFIQVSKVWSSLRNAINIDSYSAVAVTEETLNKLSPKDQIQAHNNRNYWKGQFGFDRQDQPKGIINIKWGKIEQYIEGGEPSVI